MITKVSNPLCLKLFYIGSWNNNQEKNFPGKMAAWIMRLPVNGGTRLSYYNYTIAVKNLHIYFVVSVILHINANLFYLFIIGLHYIYIITYIYLSIYLLIN